MKKSLASATGRPLVILLGLLAAGGALDLRGARAQSAECERLRAALSTPPQQDAAAAAAARQTRGDLDRAIAHARSLGCDNQQFLFFGQPPPPQCGALKARIAGMQASFDSLRARASGDSEQRRALAARYQAVCVEPQRPKNFLEFLFGGGNDARGSSEEVERIPETPLQPSPEEGGNGSRGGSQAVCVRSCDGGYFPLTFSANSAGVEELAALCKALCPNAEVQLFTRAPHRDISTALGADGTPYSDLPNALKFTKAYVPGCGCKPPNQSWSEALAPAETLLNEMGGGKASDTIVTAEQAQALSQPQAVKDASGKKGAAGGKGAPAPVVGAAPPAPAAPPAHKTVETKGPDGVSRQIRVVAPNL